MNWLSKLNPFAKKPEVNRLDGWMNPVTGLGVPTSDKAVNAYFVRDCRLTDRELSDLYHFDDICIKIVRLRPEEMFRVGYNVTVREDDGDSTTSPKKPKPLLKKEDAAADDEPTKDPASPDDQEDLGDKLRKAARVLDLDGKLLEAMCLGRAYGGGLLFCGFADGRNPEQPLNEDAPGELKFLTIFDRRELIVHEWYADPLAPNFGEPKSYMLFPRFFYGADGSKRAEGLIVHESRCVRFEGTHADRQERMLLWGWTYSVLQPVYGVVRDFENLFRSMGYMVQDANQSVFKLSGLLDQISTNSKDLQARMQLVENTRAVNRAVLLDADEGEEFMKVPTTFAGIGDVTDRFMQRLAAATDIPVSLQMGRSAAGLNATGEMDLTAFYNSVARDQENKLKPCLQRIYRLMALTMGIDPDSVVIECRPLVELTESERAELILKHAQADKLYVDSGVLTPEEVALSRFSDPEEYGLRIQLDKESLQARHESLELALENPDFSGTNASQGLGPDGKPLPAPPSPPGAPSGGSLQPGAKGAGAKAGAPVSRGSAGTGGPPRSNTKT